MGSHCNNTSFRKNNIDSDVVQAVLLSSRNREADAIGIHERTVGKDVMGRSKELGINAQRTEREGVDWVSWSPVCWGKKVKFGGSALKLKRGRD